MGSQWDLLNLLLTANVNQRFQISLLMVILENVLIVVFRDSTPAVIKLVYLHLTRSLGLASDNSHRRGQEPRVTTAAAAATAGDTRREEVISMTHSVDRLFSG